MMQEAPAIASSISSSQVTGTSFLRRIPAVISVGQMTRTAFPQDSSRAEARETEVTASPMRRVSPPVSSHGESWLSPVAAAVFRALRKAAENSAPMGTPTT